ncbi:helix-turn-helix transcriptional regulator [Streptomyces sp. SP2-10]|uniref:helix-turn-helix transcriptional regulator n=1 Tax=Streptomyces sp. SP2-10 TaxID=2873385 RepID=UPI001CA67610|nr:helix-turn-helix domain-containing protein [Streptomyces sp. SP2-10]MBY8840932.1 helix-turn-helix domain-containing protein [Streptomyces sp. SP2-10]
MAADDAYARLAGTLERIQCASGHTELTRALSTEDLSYETGIPEPVVVNLLAGGRAEETSVAQRVRQRLDFLRETRRRGDGKRYTLEEIAAAAGVTRQTMSEWRRKGIPGLESADRLRRFFALPPGFFFADEPEALDEALQRHLQAYESRSDPLAGLRTPEILRLAARGLLSPSGVQAMAQWAEAVTRSAPPVAGSGGQGREYGDGPGRQAGARPARQGRTW